MLLASHASFVIGDNQNFYYNLSDTELDLGLLAGDTRVDKHSIDKLVQNFLPVAKLC